ncbi:MAG: hypothetical protein ACI4EF_05830 [Coprococcus sp.]
MTYIVYIVFNPFIIIILWLILSPIYHKNKIKRYINEKRPQLLKGVFPECVYEPSVNHFSKKFFKEYSFGDSFQMFLGSTSFMGICSDVHMDEAILSYTDPNAGDDDEYPKYYQTIILSCKVPQGSILNMPGEVTFLEPSSMGYLSAEGIRHTLFGSHVTALMEWNEYNDRWIYCFDHGLAERLLDLFSLHRADSLKFSDNMLILTIDYKCSSTTLGFTEQHDYVVKDINVMRDTVMKLHMIANWMPGPTQNM